MVATKITVAYNLTQDKISLSELYKVDAEQRKNDINTKLNLLEVLLMDAVSPSGGGAKPQTLAESNIARYGEKVGKFVTKYETKQRKVFDADSSLLKELEKCKGQIHNYYERSLEIGLSDTPNQ